MAVKIRLRQHGRTNRRVFRIVAADARSPRDGKCLDTLGWYNPHEEAQDKQLFIDTSKLEKWMQNGAILSPKAKSLVAKVAPNVIYELHAKTHTLKEKEAKKRRARRKAQPKKTAPSATKTATKKAAPKAKAPKAKVEKVDAKAEKPKVAKTKPKTEAVEKPKAAKKEAKADDTPKTEKSDQTES